MSVAQRNQPHFCRECGEPFRLPLFPPTSPHAAVWQHIFKAHRDDYPYEYAPCSRYCTEVAQPEEEMAGHRLYGKGIPPPPRLSREEAKAKLDQLFPGD
jgi:hypothetical protein